MKSILTAVTVVLGLAVAMSAAVAHEQFAAGEPGDPKQPARVVKVIMREDGKKMLFEPAYITVRKGEQIRFILNNDGTESHEFVLATVAENRKHAQLMKKTSAYGARRPERQAAHAVHRRRDHLEIYPAWDIRVCLPHSRASRSRHAWND